MCRSEGRDLDGGRLVLAPADRPSRLPTQPAHDRRLHLDLGNLRRYNDVLASGLTLHQANDPQRLRVFLQRVAEAHGSGSAKKTKSVLNGVLAHAVDSGVLASNAMRQVRAVTATQPRRAQRGHTRALAPPGRDRVG